MGEPSYLVSTRLMEANIPQTLPSGCGFILLSAPRPELLFIALGEQTVPQQWGWGLEIITPRDSSTRAFLMSSIKQTVNILVSQGGAIISDNVTTLLDGNGNRGAARGTPDGVLLTQDVQMSFDLLYSLVQETPVSAGGSTTLWGPGPTLEANTNYIFGMKIAVFHSTGGAVRLDVKVNGAAVASLYLVRFGSEQGYLWDLPNIKFLTGPVAGVLTVSVTSISSFVGSFSATLTNPIKIK